MHESAALVHSRHRQANAHTATSSNTTSAQCFLFRMARNHITREQNLSWCGDPRGPDIPTRIPGDRDLVGRKMTPGLNLSMQECPIQLLYELYKLIWVLLTAGCFGKYSPISHLGFHWFTSVALFNLSWITACALPRSIAVCFVSFSLRATQIEVLSIG